MRDVSEYSEDGTPETDECHFDMVTLFSGKLREALESVPHSLKFSSETDLIFEVSPSPTDWALRQNFDRAVTKARNLREPAIIAARVFEEVMTRSHFFNNIIPNPKKVAFMSRPLIVSRDMYEALYHYSMQKLYGWVATADLSDGKSVDRLMKITEFSANRAYGPVAQSMQITSRNLNVEVNASRGVSQIPESAEELAKKIEEMRLKITGGFSSGEPTES